MKETESKISETNEKRICKHWLQIESCRRCLFEALCHYQDNRWDTAEVEQTI